LDASNDEGNGLNEVAKCESGTDLEAEWNTNLLDGLNIVSKNYFES
jgi:hypothetical protein